jgi:hypothetical protein
VTGATHAYRGTAGERLASAGVNAGIDALLGAAGQEAGMTLRDRHMRPVVADQKSVITRDLQQSRLVESLNRRAAQGDADAIQQLQAMNLEPPARRLVPGSPEAFAAKREALQAALREPPPPQVAQLHDFRTAENATGGVAPPTPRVLAPAVMVSTGEGPAVTPPPDIVPAILRSPNPVPMPGSPREAARAAYALAEAAGHPDPTAVARNAAGVAMNAVPTPPDASLLGIVTPRVQALVNGPPSRDAAQELLGFVANLSKAQQQELARNLPAAWQAFLAGH